MSDELRAEKQASSSSISSSLRLEKENIAIKRALRAMGCRVRFSDSDTVLALSSSDEDEDSVSSMMIPKKKVEIPNKSNGKSALEDLAVSVSVMSEEDLPVDLLRRTCGDECDLENEEGCKWPTNGCARVGSAFMGLKANFDALEHLSILDRYFNIDDQKRDAGSSAGIT